MASLTESLRTTKETPAEALARIQAGFSKNDALVVALFAARGIDPADVEPRVNVLTYRAWQAKGRQVCKGERSVKISTYIPIPAKLDAVTGKVIEPASTRPWTAAVFHVSQTKAVQS